jgi:hypothetical protein
MVEDTKGIIKFLKSRGTENIITKRRRKEAKDKH